MMPTERSPLLSIIVPVYNVEAYLHDCIDSILGQTFCDFELILVDDGSTDGCPEICDHYAIRDSRVKVIHKENGGLSSARNAGMSVAKTDLFSFIDSDDYIHPQMLDALMSPFLGSEKVDISMCRYLRCNEEEECDTGRLCIPSPQIMSSVRALGIVYRDEIPNITFVAWNKIYRRDLFVRSDVEYPEGRLYEDGFTTYRLMYEAKKIAFVDAQLYFYRIRPNSIVAGKQKVDERRMDELDADVGAWNFFHVKERELAVASTKALLRTCMNIWSDADRDGYGATARRRTMEVYRDVWNESSKLLRYEPKKWIAYRLFLTCPSAACWLFHKEVKK